MLGVLEQSTIVRGVDDKQIDTIGPRLQGSWRQHRHPFHPPRPCARRRHDRAVQNNSHARGCSRGTQSSTHASHHLHRQLRSVQIYVFQSVLILENQADFRRANRTERTEFPPNQMPKIRQREIRPSAVAEQVRLPFDGRVPLPDELAGNVQSRARSPCCSRRVSPAVSRRAGSPTVPRSPRAP